MSALHKAAGSRGGQETKRLYGIEFFAQCGSEGGRPTWQQTIERDKQLQAEAHKRSKQRNGNGNNI